MDYIFDVSKTLIIVSIACALLTMLFYKTNLYQSVRFICSVVILAYMVQAFLPFYSAIGDLIVIDEHEESEASDGTEKNENHYVNYVTVGICQKIKSIICNRYNVNDEDVKVSLTINNDDPENIMYGFDNINIEGGYDEKFIQKQKLVDSCNRNIGWRSVDRIRRLRKARRD